MADSASVSTYQFLQAFLFFPSPHAGARREAGSGFFKSSGSSSSSESMRSWRVFEAVSDMVGHGLCHRGAEVVTGGVAGLCHPCQEDPTSPRGAGPHVPAAHPRELPHTEDAPGCTGMGTDSHRTDWCVWGAGQAEHSAIGVGKEGPEL